MIFFKKTFGQTIVVEIKDLPEKIQRVRDEIIEIKCKDPYQYKFLLQDYEAVKEKKDATSAFPYDAYENAKEICRCAARFRNWKRLISVFPGDAKRAEFYFKNNLRYMSINDIMEKEAELFCACLQGG